MVSLNIGLSLYLINTSRRSPLFRAPMEAKITTAMHLNLGTSTTMFTNELWLRSLKLCFQPVWHDKVKCEVTYIGQQRSV